MLESKVVVVSGAAMRCGRQFAHSFAEERLRLSLVDIAPLDRAL